MLKLKVNEITQNGLWGWEFGRMIVKSKVLRRQEMCDFRIE